MRIGLRLLTNSMLIAGFAVIITTLLIGGVSYNYGKSILEQEAKDRLVLVRDLKADSINRYFEGVNNQAIIFSHNPTIISAMQEFANSFAKYADEVGGKGLDKYKDAVIKRYIAEFSKDYAKDNGGLEFDATPYLNLTNESTFALQYNYIFNNPFGIDKESKLETVNDGSSYSKTHKKFHDAIKEFKELFGFEDIFLVDANNGDIIYTVAKGLDFTTSLDNGPYANTALGDAFRKANAAVDNPDFVAISDFEAYSPSNDDQSAFVATPITVAGKKIGILIFQIQLTAINNIMTNGGDWEYIGLGKTGESYLIDNKKRMISESRFFMEDPKGYINKMQKLGLDAETITRMQAKNNNMGLQFIDTLGANEVVQGKTGFGIFKDYRGVEVLGAYEPINVFGLDWGIICQIDKSEAFAPVKVLAQKIVVSLTGVMVLILFFSVIVGIGLARQISVPIENLSVKVQILSKTQDLTQRIEYAVDDEIGDMTKAINSLIQSFQDTCKETILSTHKVQSAAHKLMTLADDIDSREATHKFEDNFENVHEKTEAIKDAGDSLAELSSRLQVLSRQFKVFETESERTSGW